MVFVVSPFLGDPGAAARIRSSPGGAMDTNESRSHEMTRREALRWLGVGAAATVLPAPPFAQTPSFPKGAIIRTLLKDYPPEDLFAPYPQDGKAK